MANETAFLGGQLTDYPHYGDKINGYIWLHKVGWPNFHGIAVDVYDGAPTKSVAVEPGLYLIDYCFGENTETFQANLISGMNDIASLYPQEEIKLPILKGEKGERGEKGDKGDAGQPNVLTIGTVTITEPSIPPSAAIRGNSPNQKLDLNLPRANELYGTGKPTGVINANPGTYYTDVAGTNGAWRWIKTNGTGNTGWECVYGKTSKQINIVCATYNGTCSLQRNSNMVTASITITLTGSFDVNTVIVDVPSGYRGVFTHLPGYSNIKWKSSEGRYIRLNETILGAYNGQWSWPATEEWPS